MVNWSPFLIKQTCVALHQILSQLDPWTEVWRLPGITDHKPAPSSQAQPTGREFSDPNVFADYTCVVTTLKVLQGPASLSHPPRPPEVAVPSKTLAEC